MRDRASRRLANLSIVPLVGLLLAAGPVRAISLTPGIWSAKSSNGQASVQVGEDGSIVAIYLKQFDTKTYWFGKWDTEFVRSHSRATLAWTGNGFTAIENSGGFTISGDQLYHFEVNATASSAGGFSGTWKANGYQGASGGKTFNCSGTIEAWVSSPYPPYTPTVYGAYADANMRPRISWSTAKYATWYHVWVSRNGVFYQEYWTQALNWYPTASWPSGSYSCFLSAYNGSTSAWSPASNFTIYPYAPGTPTPLEPSGTLSAGESRPIFSWYWLTGTDWYQLQLNRNGTAYLSQWVNGFAHWTPPADLPSGNYDWFVRGWNPDGLGPWSAATSFTIPVMQPEAIQQLGPSGDCSDSSLEYTWLKDDNTRWYQLWVGRTGCGSWHDKWYAEQRDSTIQSALLNNHPQGNFNWWIRGWSPDGFGPWSGPMDFSTPSPNPEPPTLDDPLGSGYYGTDLGFYWSGGARSEWYRLFVTQGSRTVLDVWTTDTYYWPTANFSVGNLSWWVGAWNRTSNTTVWSSRGDVVINYP